MKNYYLLFVTLVMIGCAPRSSFPENQVEQVKVITVSNMEQLEKYAVELKDKSITFDKLSNGQCTYLSNTFEIGGEKFTIKIDCKDVSNWKRRLRNALQALRE